MIESVPDIMDGRHNIVFGIHRSIHYHQRRRNFFEDLCPILFISGSLTTCYVLLLELAVHQLVITVATIATMSFTFIVVSTLRARQHKKLMWRYIALERQLPSVPSAQQLRRFFGLRQEIEADEPPTLHVLYGICHNEVVHMMGYHNVQSVRIYWFQRLFSQLFDLRAICVAL